MKISTVIVALVAFTLLFVGIADTLIEMRKRQYTNKVKAADEVSSLYLTYYRAHDKPPANLEDLRIYARQGPKGFESLERGEWVVAWDDGKPDGVKMDRASVIAYEMSPSPDYLIVRYGDGEMASKSITEINRDKARAVELREIAKMYRAYWKKYARGPKNDQELQPLAAECTGSYEAIKAHRWKVIWGTSLSDDAAENHDRVLAYETTRDFGRTTLLPPYSLVVNADGTGDLLSADELRQRLDEVPVAHQVVRMYSAFVKDHGKTPSKLGDLTPYSEKYPAAYGAIQQKKWIVLWGVKITGDSATDSKQVLAYLKYSPVQGGSGLTLAVFADNHTEQKDVYSLERTALVPR